MKSASKYLAAFSLATGLALSLAGAGCAEHRYGRVYDPYYSDYHVWNNDEVVYYQQWSNETHRDSHREFRRLPPDEQKEYWTWRHNHEDRDHDRDRDKDHH
jgi:hypothetical protein